MTMKISRMLIAAALALTIPVTASAESTITTLGSAPVRGPLLGAAAGDGSSPAKSAKFSAPSSLNPTKLYHMSKSADPAARLFVASAIRRSSRAEMIHAARVLIQDDDVRVRRALLGSLAAKEAKRWIPLLTEALTDRDPEVRLFAARGLVQHGPEVYAEPMKAMVDDPSAAVRRVVLDSLMSAGPDGISELVAIEIGARPVSAELLDEVDQTLHRHAANHGDQLVAALDLSKVERSHMQRVANLVADCGPIGTSMLLAEMDGGLSQRAFYARRALAAHPRYAVKPINARLMEFRLKGTKSALITPFLEVLAAAGDPRALPGLERLATSNRPYLRSEALLVLGRIDHPRAVELLIDGLSDPEADVRGSAAAGLGEQRAEAGIKPLIRVVARGDAISVKAIRALGQIGDRRAALVLERQLESENPVVRRYACEALENIGHRSARKSLSSKLNDPDAMVRYTASRALGSME
jgi:HEAT repeat protein